jgi:ZIP family zinc transporter
VNPPAADATVSREARCSCLHKESGMDGQFLIVFSVALAAALASPLGGAIAIFVRPSSLFLSIAVGLAGGVLLGTFAFEMLPKALKLSGLAVGVAGFAVGFALVYGLDLYVNRGTVAGSRAEQRRRVERFHKGHRPLGSEVTVLAGATSVEELIEGITIGVGAAIDPSVAVIVGLAIFIDNISEGLSIGELAREESGKDYKARTLKWTGLMGAALFGAAMAGWFLLRGLPDGLLGFLLAVGAGGMFYLTVTDLIPEAETHHYLQSAAIAGAIGFLVMLVLSELT